MVNKNIPALPNAHGLDGSESFHGNQGADSREISVDQISAYVQGLQQETLVTLVGDQAVAVSTLTKVDWDTETRDEGVWHESVTNKDRMTTGAGVFDAISKIHLITLAADATWGVEIGRYNSSAVLQEVVAEDSGTISVAGDIVVTPTALNVRMNAGDFLRVSVISSDTSYSVESDDSYFMVRTAGLVPQRVGFSGALAYVSTTQSITSSTTKLDLASELFDTDNYHDNVTNNSRLTIPEDGWYVATGGTSPASSGTFTYHRCSILHNTLGTIGIQQMSRTNGTAAFQFQTCTSSPQFMAAGSYVELEAAWLPTTNAGQGAANCFLSIMRVDSLTGAAGASEVFSGARIYADTARSYTTSAIATIFDVEVYDTDNYATLGTNDTRLTVPVSGYYEFTGQNTRDNIAGANFQRVQMRKNGSEVISNVNFVHGTVVATDSGIQGTTGPIWMDAGDYMEMLTAMNPTENSLPGAENMWFAVKLVGRANGGTGADLIEDLRDVDLATVAPAAGDMLEFDGTNWIPTNIGKMVQVSNSTDQTMGNGSNEPFEWNTDDYSDDAAFHDTGTNNSRVTAPWTGRYRVNYKTNITSIAGSAETQAWVSLNRALDPTSPPVAFFDDFPILRTEMSKPSTSGTKGLTTQANAVITLTANDYIQLVYWVTPANNPVAAQTHLSLTYLGPT